MARIPVVILTGFLGAGKTTLLNRILTAPHGHRIAVIINEFGEVGIDHHLIVASEEEIFQMNNGCICCTVQGDLLRVLLQLLERRETFDYLVVETSGLADPTVIVQTLLLDERIRMDFELQAVVTVVDGMHVEQQLAAQHEAREQVACADAILLNKTDLITPEEADTLAARLGELNPMARVTPTRNAEVDIGELLEMRAFDLEAKRRLVENGHHHEHQASVQTVSFVQPGDLNKTRLSHWFRSVLAEKGPDILRMKGILNMHGDSHQFVFHGVHSMFEGRLGREWEEKEERLNRLV
ncbi:MAG: GTP-binding protein, partial [Deltaproteobacteria bacterium]|nr:GTP-binding protein [Deltaproteobacteria bacterium]